MTKKRKVRRNVSAFKRAFGAKSITPKNVDRGITNTRRASKLERADIRREVGRQTRDAQVSGNKRDFNRGKKVLRETTDAKSKKHATTKARAQNAQRRHHFAQKKEKKPWDRHIH